MTVIVDVGNTEKLNSDNTIGYCSIFVLIESGNTPEIGAILLTFGYLKLNKSYNSFPNIIFVLSAPYIVYYFVIPLIVITLLKVGIELKNFYIWNAVNWTLSS